MRGIAATSLEKIKWREAPNAKRQSQIVTVSRVRTRITGTDTIFFGVCDLGFSFLGYALYIIVRKESYVGMSFRKKQGPVHLYL